MIREEIISCTLLIDYLFVVSSECDIASDDLITVRYRFQLPERIFKHVLCNRSERMNDHRYEEASDDKRCQLCCGNNKHKGFPDPLLCRGARLFRREHRFSEINVLFPEGQYNQEDYRHQNEAQPKPLAFSELPCKSPVQACEEYAVYDKSYKGHYIGIYVVHSQVP